MMTKCIIFVVLALISSSQASVLPLPAAAAIVAPYASSYNAHTVNHAIATPVAAPLIAAAPAPYFSAPAALAHPAALAAPAFSPYTALPAASYVF